jgi:hypothetical protein
MTTMLLLKRNPVFDIVYGSGTQQGCRCSFLQYPIMKLKSYINIG